MIKVTKETIDGYSAVIINDKVNTNDDIISEIKKENEYFFTDSVALSRVSEPGFMAGWLLAYCTIKRQIENDNFKAVDALDYKKGSEAKNTYFKWKYETPTEKHHTVSFVAGYNAALNRGTN